MRHLLALLIVAVLALGEAAPVRAWGAFGHRIIGAVAAGALPESMPPFVRTAAAVAELRALSPEADRLRGAGREFDGDRDAAHFLDLDDDGTIAGAVPLASLPPTRSAFETALRATGRMTAGRPATQWETGYLPYEIIEGWEQVVRDFAYWRVDRYGETHAAGEADRTAFAADRQLRETLTLRDIGYWSHFVEDGSQPLHVTVHYNGWGNFPNPQHYSTSNTLHARFETAFVDAHASEALVAPRVGPYVAGTGPFPARVAAYLKTTSGYVPAVYQLEGTNAFTAGTPEAVSFVLDRLADGARALRNWTIDAYASAADQKVGYPAVLVRDVESGSVQMTPRNFGD